MLKKNFSASDLNDKWGENALAMGWTAIPTSLFFLQNELQLNSTTLNILINLLIHWWSTGDWPHPSQERIAKRMNVSTRTVQRGLSELEDLGLITKIKTPRDSMKYRGRNKYDLSKLIKKLNELTPEMKKAIDKGTRKIVKNDNL